MYCFPIKRVMNRHHQIRALWHLPQSKKSSLKTKINQNKKLTKSKLKQQGKSLKSRKMSKKMKISHYSLKLTKKQIYWANQQTLKMLLKVKIRLRVGSITSNHSNSKAITNLEKIIFSKNLPNNQPMFSIQIP